jgi:SAM-dependent methyltransferase
VTERTAASRGLPSAVWRFGQDRRLAIIEGYAPLAGARALDVGCGVGMYTARMDATGAHATGVEVDWPRLRAARADGLTVAAAVGEALPFADASFDVVLLHEVLEHVRDDRRTAREITRVLAPGGRAVVFVPNRLWPFETHGIMWRGGYRFGNIPLVNYLPDGLRNRLAPHVRVYTSGTLARLFADLPVTVVAHRQVFPGYDKLAARRPAIGRALRGLSRALERTPLACFGLSHMLVVQRHERDQTEDRR